MWFTRTDDSFRAWFQVVTNAGVLRTDALSSSFTALVINPADSATSTATVTQSLQKPGLYYFDVPSSFLTASGPGEYGVSVEVNITTSPKVVSAFSDVLRVSYNDFDTITSASLSASYTISTSSIQSIVSGVWSATTSSYNTLGTMGYFQVFPVVSVSASVSASVDVSSIVSGVWNAQTATFVSPGTMGLTLSGLSASMFTLSQSQAAANTLLTDISSSLTNISSDISFISSSVGVTYTTLLQVSSSVDLSYQTLIQVSSSVASISSSINTLLLSASNLTTASIAAGVWDEILAGHSISGSSGLALRELGSRVHEIYQILGLQLGSPMTVTQTLRTVAAISQSLAGDPTTSVTVTRL